MKYISLLLHLYQPPTQDLSLVKEIDEECYTPLAALLEKTGARVALNMNYSLTEQLQSLSSPALGNLAAATGIEFTDSAAFHTILPLADSYEVARQLRLNHSGNRSILGERYAPTGVFPPEMAYSTRIASLLAEAGYLWTITDDLPLSHAGGEPPNDQILSSGGIAVFLRSNFWSNRISFHGEDGEEMLHEIESGLEAWAGKKDSYMVLAMDGETFGHHRKGAIEGFLQPFLKAVEGSAQVDLATPGMLLGLFPLKEEVVPDGSWSTTTSDLDAGKPWPLWSDPDNPVHVRLRALRDRVLALARSCGDPGVARKADEMLYSCPFWWASTGRFDAVQIRRGLLSILETALAVYHCTGDRTKLDSIATEASSIPVVTGEEKEDA